MQTGSRELRGLRIGAALVASLLQIPFALATASGLASTVIQASGAVDTAAFDGTVEAVRQTVIGAQVPGAIVSLSVKAGDAVREGQVLLRIDARAAEQNSMAGAAQVQAARSALDVATKDYERQRQLLERQYISQAAFERAEAQFRATSAQLKAQIAQASAAQIESNFYVVKAPYAGLVAEVPVMVGDMAMPGKPLVTLYDPAALRVTAAVPQSAIVRLASGKPANIELPALPAERQWLVRPDMQILPTIDAGTHSAQVRIALPAGLKGVVPGMFARVWLPLQGTLQGDTAGDTARHLHVPASAIVRRAEMTGLYVLDSGGRPLLRQVRLGQSRNDRVEVLAGVSAGDRIALDPQAAAKEGR